MKPAARPAVRGGLELAPFLESHGRTFTGGHCESVGLGGFLLQGGQGWDSRRWGWGCENVVAIDVVGLSYREAARALRVREATITTRLHRARQRVADALTDAS